MIRPPRNAFLVWPINSCYSYLLQLMRYSRFYSLFVVAGLFTAQASLAQRAAVEPVTPRMPAVQPSGPMQSALPNQQPVAQVFAPTVRPVRPQAIPAPLILLNSSIIIDESFLGVSAQEIGSLMVYKGGTAPLQWRALAAHGIIDVSLKSKRAGKVKSQTLADVGKRLKLTGPVRYSVNGMPTTDTSLRIASQSIGDVKVTPATADNPLTLIDIQTARRIVPPSAVPASGPPRIMIRGTASL
ncbi:MAG: hypothetical protein JWP58_4479 [Hymenobacter sp.]|nr:hypothetical protein [Hymenobacter sp.]